DWSPEQVSGKLEITISHERIYQPIWADKQCGGTLYQHLRHSNKKRKTRYGSKDKRGQIRNRISIDERPEIVAQKTRIGDWERGLNENTNGLIRQYFTKGSSFENITDDAVEAVMHKLNHRPRKTLNFRTPHEVFFAEKEKEAA
ncbi:MAG: IS30 family transposase, partial [Methylobacter sp.]|uniref:transposase n=1 Tax=Methylobacter sp. TaxID=2051955 RepID=UPI00275784C8|nr:IS30 family transposase [Methylobacter sp.]